MKKQNLHKKLSLKTAKVSKLGDASAIIGGATKGCNSQPICEITNYARCGHTRGDTLDTNGNPCEY